LTEARNIDDLWLHQFLVVHAGIHATKQALKRFIIARLAGDDETRDAELLAVVLL
jgi:hypothetical protein